MSTMFHFLNCLLLTFAPPVIMYRSTQLCEESALKKCAFAGLGYAVTQVIKIFAMATFLPSDPEEITDMDGEAGAMLLAGVEFNMGQEGLKAICNLLELAGMYLTLTYIPQLSKFEHSVRILAVGLGWSFADSAALYFVPLWLGATGMEFSWEYIEMGIAANIDMLLHFAVIAAVWLRSRTDLERQGVPLVMLVLSGFCVLPGLKKYMTIVLEISTWNQLIIRLCIALAMGISMRILMSRYVTHRAKSD